MKVSLNVTFMLAGATLLSAMVVCTPSWLSNDNSFLRSFIGEPLLSALGVILAINLASLAQLHLSLNKIEEERKRRFLGGARAEIRSSARWMVALFVAAIVVVAAKPLAGDHIRLVAIVNAMAIYILGFYILIMADIIEAVFDLEPDIEEAADTEGREG